MPAFLPFKGNILRRVCEMPNPTPAFRGLHGVSRIWKPASMHNSHRHDDC